MECSSIPLHISLYSQKYEIRYGSTLYARRSQMSDFVIMDKLNDLIQSYDMSQQKVMMIFTNAQTGAGENITQHSVIDNDKINLVNTFGERGFKVLNIRVNNYSEIKEKIEEMSKQDHEETSCIFIVMFMDCDIASDENYTMKYFQKLFEECHETLLNKPKVFLVHIYKSKIGTRTDDDVDRRHIFENYLHAEFQRESEEERPRDGPLNGDKATNETISSHSDIFLAQSTYEYEPENVNDEGSPWIKYICDIVKDCITFEYEIDIVDLFVKVNDQITNENSHAEMPLNLNALTKNLNI